MSKITNAVTVAELLSNHVNEKLMARDVLEILQGAGMNLSTSSARKAVDKMYDYQALSKYVMKGKRTFYVVHEDTLVKVIQFEKQRLRELKSNKRKPKEYAKSTCKKPEIKKNKVFWGDKLSGVGTVFISGACD